MGHAQLVNHADSTYMRLNRPSLIFDNRKYCGTYEDPSVELDKTVSKPIIAAMPNYFEPGVVYRV
jgi:hypothetical protein